MNAVKEQVKTKTKVKCGDCKGQGFTEEEAGLVTIECEACNGTGYQIKEVLSDGSTRTRAPRVKPSSGSATPGQS